MKPSPLAAALWTRWPALDNPLAEIFAERVAALEPARLPVASAGCEKILIVGDGNGASWPETCPAAALPDFCQSNNMFCYANRSAGGYDFVAAAFTPAWQAEVTHPNLPKWDDGILVISQESPKPQEMKASQTTGWSYPETLDEPTKDPVARQWRWIGGRGEVAITAAASTIARVKITARSLNRPRRLKVSTAATELATFLVQETRAEYQSSEFVLPAGTSVMTLESLEPGESPTTGDPRLLSIAVFRIEIVATKR